MYASQQHEQFLPDGTRAGFLIGDGAGVGKGRTIAGNGGRNSEPNRNRLTEHMPIDISPKLTNN